MRPSENLFLLIQSLTPTEKRYFKVSATVYETEQTPTYMRLFDYLDTQESYDEVAVKAYFKKEKFVKQLTFTKNTLYHKILKSLRNYYSSGKEVIKTFQYREALDNVELLYKKGLYKAAEQEIRRIKKIAIQYEALVFHLQIIQWEKKLRFQSSPKHIDTQLDNCLQEETLILNKLNNYHFYDAHYWKFSVLIKKKALEKEVNKLQALEKLVQHPLLTDESQALSFLAKIRFHNIKGSYSRYIGNIHVAYIHHKQVMELWENHPQQVALNPTKYRVAICNFLGICHLNSYFEDYLAGIEKVKQLTQTYQLDPIKNFHITTSHQIIYYLNTASFKEALVELPVITQQLEEYKNQINVARLLSIYYNIGLLYFFLDKYDNALYWFNEILNHPKVAVRKDTKQIVKLLQLIIHYELGNDFILENLYRSAYRAVKKEEVHGFEKKLLTYLRPLTKHDGLDKAAEKADFIALKKILEELMDQNKVSLGCQEMWFWVEAKLTQQPIAIIFKKTLEEG